MPKTLNAFMEEAVSAHGSTLATCWRITRTDGEVFGFTSHTKDLEPGDGVTYIGRTGYTPSNIVSSSDLAVDNLDIEGVVQSDLITAEDIRAGAYDYAEVHVFEVDYTDPTAGSYKLRRGFLGELTLRDEIYVTEIRGIVQALARMFMRVTQGDCDAELFDSRCKLVKDATNTNTGEIATIVTERYRFTVTLVGTARAAGFYTPALIHFTTGLATGRKMEVRKHLAGDELVLYIKSPWLLAVGDEFEIQRECLKTVAACQSFDNFVNFRGFHKVPGKDRMQAYPRVKGGAGDTGKF